MSKMMNKTFRLTVLATALATVYGIAQAGDEEVQQLTQPESSISIGVGNWSGDRPQQGIYDDMREGKTYGLLDLSVIKRDVATGTWMTFGGSNLGLDTRSVNAEWLRQGDIGVSLDFTRTPRDNPLTFNTGLQGVGSDNLSVSGAGASALPKRDITLGTQRDMTSLGLYKSFSHTIDLQVSFKNEKKEGTRQWGLGSAAYFLVEPIDSTTRQLEAILSYKGERLQLSGGYYGGWYDNSYKFVQGTINGKLTGTTSAPITTPLSQPLDNQFHQLYLNGGYSFTPTTRGTLKLSYGKATQDERLPVFAAPSNPFIGALGLPGAPSSLDGKINTTLVEAGLTSRPLPKLSLSANLRYYNVDDKTPLAGYIGSNTTGVASVYNTPHSIKTKSGKLEATYRLPQDFSLIGGFEYKSQDRSAPTVGSLYVPFSKELDEKTYRLQLRRSISETVNGSLAYLHSNRDGSPYVSTGDAVDDSINPMHIADRERDKWRAAIDWAPSEKLSLQFVLEDSTDEYGPSGTPQGLQDGSARLYSVDMNYVVSDAWQVNGWYTRDENKAKLRGYRYATTGAANAQKESRLNEVGDSFGFGLSGQASAMLKLGGNLEWSRDITEQSERLALSGAGTAFPITGGQTVVGPLANINNKLTRLKLFAEYALNKNADLRFDLVHERWHSDDWTWQFANGTPFSYGSTEDGTTVTAKAKQSSNFVGARYIYKFQ